MKMTSRSHNAEEIHFQLRSKAVLNSDEMDLYELSQLAGITVDPQIFKIILDLLKLNVSPAALASTLHSMCSSRHGGRSLLESSHSSQAHSISHDGNRKPEQHSGRSASLPNSASNLVSDSAHKSRLSSRSHVSSRDHGKQGSTYGNVSHTMTDGDQFHLPKSTRSSSSRHHRANNSSSSYRH